MPRRADPLVGARSSARAATPLVALKLYRRLASKVELRVAPQDVRPRKANMRLANRPRLAAHRRTEGTGSLRERHRW
jgi:hypothetical protein